MRHTHTQYTQNGHWNAAAAAAMTVPLRLTTMNTFDKCKYVCIEKFSSKLTCRGNVET